MVVAPANATFPGANGRIAYSARTGGPGNPASTIFTANPDGSDERLLAPGGRLSWSADGAKIIYEQSGLKIINADGTGGPVTTCCGNDPAWSPDGTRIASTLLASNGQEEVYVVSLSTLQARPITGNSGFDGQPAWSADGTKVAFTSVRFGQPFDVYTVDPEGLTEPVNLTSNPARDLDPVWSPDGRNLAFTSTRGGNTDVYVMNADGTDQTRLTTDPAADEAAAWSPDGRKILFRTQRHAQPVEVDRELYLMNADGTNETRITFTDGRDEFDADWQPIPNRPPDCSEVVASRQVLTTINRKLVAITLDRPSDPDGDPVTLLIDGVTQDEPVTARGDATSPDAIDYGQGELRLRAERNPHGDGRVYRIEFTAADGKGGSCSGTAKDAVPRKKRVAAVDSAPPSYDSFAR